MTEPEQAEEIQPVEPVGRIEKANNVHRSLQLTEVNNNRFPSPSKPNNTFTGTSRVSASASAPVPPQGDEGNQRGRTTGGVPANPNEVRSNVAAAAIARQTAAPSGVSSETAAKLKDKQERDELHGKIENLAFRLREDVPIAIRSRETPLGKIRSYKTYLEQKCREQGK